MKLPDVSGVYDYAGPTRDSRYRPRRFAFHQLKSVGVLIASFRSSIPSPPVPLFTLRHAPHGTHRKTRGRVVRYSFLVGLLHSLLHAGLSRRTELAIMRSSSSSKTPEYPTTQELREEKRFSVPPLPDSVNGSGIVGFRYHLSFVGQVVVLA